MTKERLPNEPEHGAPAANERREGGREVPQLKKLADMIAGGPRMAAQRKMVGMIQAAFHRTGLPDGLKAGAEQFSGYSLDTVGVHRNSLQPAQLQVNDVIRQRAAAPSAEHAATSETAANQESYGDSRNRAFDLPPMQASARSPVQRITINDGDFSNITNVEALGGAENAAFKVEDASGAVFMKLSDRQDSAALSYNLAKDFGVKVPKSTQARLTPADRDRLVAAIDETERDDFRNKLAAHGTVILSEFVEGENLGMQKEKFDENLPEFAGDKENFRRMGRMMVFDMAVMNYDRFKVESNEGDNPAPNSGNLMIANNQPVGLDQDFARYNPTGDNPMRNLEDQGSRYAERIRELLSDPQATAAKFVTQMAANGYYFFLEKQDSLAEGIIDGVDILTGLLQDDNPRLDQLVAWSKTFQPGSDFNATNIRTYWRSILPVVE